MRLKHLIYGDFNCPYSYAASCLADTLVSDGTIDVEWRAVEHDPAIPANGQVLEVVGAHLATDVRDVSDRLCEWGGLRIRVPPVLPNTRSTTNAFAGCHGRDAAALRRHLFAALWCDARNIGRRDELDRIVGGRLRWNSSIAEHWRASWQGLDAPTVPMMMLPTGWVLRGVAVLEHLAPACPRVESEVVR